MPSAPAAPVLRPRRVRAVRAERGQALVEAALTFPLLLLVAIGLVQFALFVHAQGVVTGAVQDGARIAAAEGRTPADGVTHAEALLDAGLGRSARDVTVRGSEGGGTVALEAQGRLRAIVPWVADATLPLGARAVMSKEGFRAGPAR
jgi:Flp pilus assembly protein TadG